MPTTPDNSDAVNLATADLFQAEIERLRSQPCPYVTGNVTKYCTLTPLTLTDAERGAVEEAIDWYVGVDDDRCQQVAATLRGLLERTANRDTTPPRNGTRAECTDSGGK